MGNIFVTQQFFEAVQAGDLDLVKECLSKGINKDAKTSNGTTGLHIACSSGHFAIVKYLIETYTSLFPNNEYKQKFSLFNPNEILINTYLIAQHLSNENSKIK